MMTSKATGLRTRSTTAQNAKFLGLINQNSPLSLDDMATLQQTKTIINSHRAAIKNDFAHELDFEVKDDFTQFTNEQKERVWHLLKSKQ